MHVMPTTTVTGTGTGTGTVRGTLYVDTAVERPPSEAARGGIANRQHTPVWLAAVGGSGDRCVCPSRRVLSIACVEVVSGNVLVSQLLSTLDCLAAEEGNTSPT